MARAGVIGAIVGAAAAAAAGGIAAERYLVRPRRRRTADDYDFTALAADREPEFRTEDGVALHVEEVGPAKAPLTVIFLHGYTLSLRSFDLQRAALAEEYGERIRMIFYDQRSHGRSEASVPDSATIDQLGRDLYAVITALVPAGPVVLVGHSMGGLTIQEFAAQFPQLLSPERGRAWVAGAALIDTSSGQLAQVSLGLPAPLGRMQSRLSGAILRTARRRAGLAEGSRRIGTDLARIITKRLSFGSKAVSPAVVDFVHEMISATPIEAIADFHPALMNHDGTVGVAALKDTDVAIIVGERDVMTPLVHSNLLADQLPRATLTVVPDAGHLAMLERPDEVNDALADLIDRVRDDAASGRRRKRG